MSMIIAKPTVSLMVTRGIPLILRSVNIIKNVWDLTISLKNGFNFAKNKFSRSVNRGYQAVPTEEEDFDCCAICKRSFTDNNEDEEINLIMFRGCNHRFHYECFQKLKNCNTLNLVKGKCAICSKSNRIAD